MARRRQHIADNDPDESAEDLGSTPMSPNTKRKEALKRIMDVRHFRTSNKDLETNPPSTI